MLDHINRQLLMITLVLMIIGFLFGNLGLVVISGATDAAGIVEMASVNPQRLRIAVLISHLLTFAVPGILALLYVYRGDWWAKADLGVVPSMKILFPVVIFATAALPLVALSVWINQQVPLPDWAMQAEEGTAEMTAAILDIDGPLALLTALLAIAVSAGVGEELIFRGILQKQVLGKLPHHLAIWVAAAAFSLIHFELAGFLPRMILGAVLGYAYYWTKSLWVPILLHAIFNGLQVMAVYWTGEFTPDTEAVELPNMLLLAASIAVAGGLAYQLEKSTSSHTPTNPLEFGDGNKLT